MIDIKKFKENWNEIDDKCDLIRKLPMLRHQEQDYDGWELDTYNGKDWIIINSSYYYSGCGEDTSSVEILLEDINQPISWFKQKFQNEIDEHRRVEKERELEKERKKEEQAVRFEEIQRKKDLETYERIKKQLEQDGKHI